MSRLSALTVTYVGASGFPYGIVRNEQTGQVWDEVNQQLATWSDINLDNYDIPMSNAGGDLYQANLPGAVPYDEIYRFVYYERIHPSPRLDDALLDSEIGIY